MSIKFARLAFIDGDLGGVLIDTMYEADMPRTHATVALGLALIDAYETGEYHDVHDEPARGTFDQVVAFGTYYLTFHMGLHYVGLERAVAQRDIDGLPDDEPYPWCGLCGEWADHCLGHGSDMDEQVEASEALKEKFLRIIRGEG